MTGLILIIRGRSRELKDAAAKEQNDKPTEQTALLAGKEVKASN